MSFWDVYVQGHESLFPLSPLWMMRKQHRETEASKGGIGSGDTEPHGLCLHAEPATSRREMSGKLCKQDNDASGVMGWPRRLTGVTRVAQSRGTVHVGCYRCYSL